MRIIHLAPGDPTEFFELGNRATQGGFFKFLVGLNEHFSQSPATMRPTFPLTFSMDADVLEQQLAQLFSQCCIGFTKKSFAASALKPTRNGPVFPTYHTQATLDATLLAATHGGGSGRIIWTMKNEYGRET